MAEQRRGLEGAPAAGCVVRRCGGRAFRIEGDLHGASAETLLCSMGEEIAGKVDGDLILLSPQPDVVVVLKSAKICERFPNIVVFCTPRPRH